MSEPVIVSDAVVEAEVEKVEAEAAAKVRETAVQRAKRIAETEAKERAKRDAQDAKLKADAEAKRAAAHKAYVGLLADYMVANGVENPRVIDDAVVFALKAQAGL